MTHSQIVAYLETQALAAGAASFWHGKQAQANINYNAPFPQAHLFTIDSVINGGWVAYQMQMCFYGQDQHENGSADSIFIQNAMDVLTQRFYALLREETMPGLVKEEMVRRTVLREGARIGTGYFLVFSLQVPAQC